MANFTSNYLVYPCDCYSLFNFLIKFNFSIMSDGSGDGYANNATSNSTSSQQNSRDTAVDRLVQHFKNHKVDSVMWFLRVMTIFFIFAYLVPIFG